jgi:hypothetical protein
MTTQKKYFYGIAPLVALGSVAWHNHTVAPHAVRATECAMVATGFDPIWRGGPRDLPCHTIDSGATNGFRVVWPGPFSSVSSVLVSLLRASPPRRQYAAAAMLPPPRASFSSASPRHPAGRRQQEALRG